MPVVATQLALHYLPKTESQVGPLKYVVLLGYLGTSGLAVNAHPTITFLTVISVESVVDCTPGSRDLRHFSARVAWLREIDATGSYAQRNPHCDGPIHMLPRYATHRFISHLMITLGGPRTDGLLYVTGHGDTDLTFRKTANAMFFCATNPDPNANGSVWALLHDGTIQRMEEAQERGSLGGPPAYTDL